MLATCSLLFNLGNTLGNIFENFETHWEMKELDVNLLRTWWELID